MKHRFPPLWTWATALALAAATIWLIGGSGLIDIRSGFGANYSSLKKRLAHVRSSYQIAAADKVVVIVGSSFTGMSIAHRPYFQERHQRERGGNLHVIKLYMYGGNADRFQQLPEFFEMLEYLEPDLVCVEEHLLAISDGAAKQGPVQATLSNFHLGVDAIKQQLFPSVDDEERHDLETFEFFWKYHHESYGPDSLQVGPASPLRIRNYTENKAVNDQLAQHLPEDAQLVCLAIPRPRYVEEKLVELRKAAPFQVLEQAYQDEFDMITWTYPRILPYRLFSGDDHLNAQGMAQFSDWLYEQIDQQLYP